MQLDRREFLNLAAAGVASGLLASIPLAHATARPRIKAIAFDAFPIFDPRSVFALAEQLFPGRGAELSNAWRTRQFEYTWLRTVMSDYADFCVFHGIWTLSPEQTGQSERSDAGVAFYS